jgi:ssDNA-binding Zn-finger/Zn-ribbon topoisomerase 1
MIDYFTNCPICLEPMNKINNDRFGLTYRVCDNFESEHYVNVCNNVAQFITNKVWVYAEVRPSKIDESSTIELVVKNDSTHLIGDISVPDCQALVVFLKNAFNPDYYQFI